MPFQVYAFGSNGSGQLALGHTEDVATPEMCKVLNIQLTSQPCKIAAGGNHTLMLCRDGSLYVAGDTEGGRCIVQENAKLLTSFQRVKFYGIDDKLVNNFAHCSATWEASTLVSIDGKVYTCGVGRKGELGQGLNRDHSISPRLIADFPPAGTKIVDLEACMSHTVAVLSNGDVYGWGAGRKGQLGEPAETVWTPRKIECLSFSVFKVACGREFTCLIGSATSGALAVIGSDKWKIRTSAPQSVTKWRAVYASWGGIHILYDNGSLLGWGRNDHGQQSPPDMTPIRKIVVGSEHVLACEENGKVLAWGWGEHGNCGAPIDAAARTCNLIASGQQFSILGAGCATSWLYCDNSVR